MLHKLKIPTSFSVVKKGSITFFVKEPYKEIIINMIINAGYLHNKDGSNVTVKFGRGSYLSIPVTHNNAERFVIRNYRHGGLLGKLFGGVFCDGNRPLNEIYINEIASQKGVPSAEVIAITKRKLWGFFYKADFITKEISGAVDITQFLKESSLQSIQKSKKPIIFALVKLIRSMHDAGIYHADLHLKNILLKKDLNGEFNAYIIDLDKSVILNTLSINQRVKNLLRLDRSLEKLRWLSGATNISQTDTRDPGNHQFNRDCSPSNDLTNSEKLVPINKKLNLISRTDRIRFFKSYMLHNPFDKDWKKYIRQYPSSYSLHKFWWRVLGLSPK